MNWNELSRNSNAIRILEQHLDKVDWWALSENPNAIHIFEQNLDKINWYWISRNPNAIDILKENQHKIYWYSMSHNPSIFILDYDALKERCAIYKEELIQKALHPSRIQKILDLGLELEDLDNYI